MSCKPVVDGHRGRSIGPPPAHAGANEAEEDGAHAQGRQALAGSGDAAAGAATGALHDADGRRRSPDHPVWVDVEADGSTVLINTAAGRVKTENIERDPRVSVSVVDKGNDWRYALVRGRVVEQRIEGADAHIDAMAKKYLGQDSYPFRNAAEQRVILVIKPDHVIEQGT
jgi:PPOX class probable F420-dependent enzyme